MTATQTRRGVRKLPSPGELQACAARSLQHLQVIEATVSAVTSDCDMLRLLTRDLADIAERLHRRASTAYRAAVDDADLHDDDGVADAWEDCVTAAADLHGAAQSLRERVVLLDRLKSPRSGTTYASEEDLFAAMGL